MPCGGNHGAIGCRLEAPAKVGLYLFGDARALYNFRDEEVEMRLDKRVVKLGANRLAWFSK